ncbi:MAG: WecB/TagA/CpsF family glycosyltransferase [bacterium]
MNLRKIVKNHVFSDSLDQIDLTQKSIINTINPHSYCVALNDKAFQKALTESDVLLPDGTGIVIASMILFGKKIRKIAGADIHQHLLEYANENHKKVFYLGASQNTLDLIEKRIKNDYPNVHFSCYSPPYKQKFTENDSKIMLEKVNNVSPDVLFVGMTAPKQEKWVDAHKELINAQITTSIGAVFDFYAGTVQRSGKAWIYLGLEWLPRLLREPKRLWKRNFVSTPLFLWYLFLSKLKLQ